jgi:hypothetical protein
MRTAIGAVIVATSTPARPGVVISATASLAARLLFASSTRRRPTRSGTKDW